MFFRKAGGNYGKRTAKLLRETVWSNEWKFYWMATLKTKLAGKHFVTGTESQFMARDCEYAGDVMVYPKPTLKENLLSAGSNYLKCPLFLVEELSWANVKERKYSQNMANKINNCLQDETSVVVVVALNLIPATNRQSAKTWHGVCVFQFFREEM
eukprot:TRINITY_DN49872_c0_g1_i3.p1 TRINITY_DN49872_c0_g1~~TRINITY_DN49872_c0_g1_i3.p1  ORF type:complete len:155 (+),score=3.87 TRINITY_DN49872_c0_g1_i3:53-517(+)